MQSLQKLFTLVPAATLLAGLLQAIIFYGPLSVWLKFFTVQDYLVRAVNILPSMVLLGMVGLAIGLVNRPMRGDEETDAEYAKRTGIDQVFREKEDSFANAASLLIFALFFLSPAKFIPLFVLVLIVLNLHHILHVANFSSGGRIYNWLNSNSYMRIWMIIVSVASVSWIWFSVSIERERMREFDVHRDCNTAICVDGQLVIDQLSAGLILYSDGTIFLNAYSDDEIIQGPYSPGTGRPLVCAIPRLCEFVTEGFSDLSGRWTTEHEAPPSIENGGS